MPGMAFRYTAFPSTTDAPERRDPHELIGLAERRGGSQAAVSSRSDPHRAHRSKPSSASVYGLEVPRAHGHYVARSTLRNGVWRRQAGAQGASIGKQGGGGLSGDGGAGSTSGCLTWPVAALVIYNALPEPARAPTPVSFAPPRLLCVGRVTEQKGFDTAIAAMPRVREAFPDAELMIAGDGDARRSLVELARRLNVSDCVHMAGWVPPEDVPGLIDRATLVLMPSRWEPFGLVALQAAAAQPRVCGVTGRWSARGRASRTHGPVGAAG